MSFKNDRQHIITELEKQALRFPSHSAKRPFITLSFAQSLDGCLASDPKTKTTISHKESAVLTHQIRSSHQGILVGINTVKVDNPRLNVRHIAGPSPRIIIIDPNLESPLNSNIFTQRNQKAPIIICGHHVSKSKIESFREKCFVELIICDLRSKYNLQEPLSEIYKLGIRSLMVEGGGRTIFRFIQEKLVDYFIMTISPIFLGSSNSVRYSNFGQSINDFINSANYKQIGTDLIVFGSSSQYCEKGNFIGCH